MALFLLIDEDGVATQTDLEPDSDHACWPTVIRINYRSEDGTYHAHTPSCDGWRELPEA